MTSRERRELAFGQRANTLQIQEFSILNRGQSYPQHYPRPSDRPEHVQNPLGVPLGIRDVARLIGCSVWTVRQSYIPQGLPHLRSGPSGKLIFYRDQVVRWILEHQQKGVNRK